jgi:ubiquinone/menaquinone biosynthesis C-methylase UbiE
MQKYSIYDNFVQYYDLLYPWKDYETEVEKIKKLVSEYKESEGNKLLEIACGTGGHTQYLQDYFKTLATDINVKSFDVACNKAKNVNFKEVDMMNMDLDEKFDVIVCLSGSVALVKEYKNLRKTIENFSHYLKKGGIVIIEPFFNKEELMDIAESPGLTTYKYDQIEIIRAIDYEFQDNFCITNRHYLIAERRKKIKYFFERIDMGLFESKEFIQSMKDFGLQPYFLKDGPMSYLKDLKKRWEKKKKGRGELGVYIGVKK